jgi:hypothetical protein
MGDCHSTSEEGGEPVSHDPTDISYFNRAAGLVSPDFALSNDTDYLTCPSLYEVSVPGVSGHR